MKTAKEHASQVQTLKILNEQNTRLTKWLISEVEIKPRTARYKLLKAQFDELHELRKEFRKAVTEPYTAEKA